MDSYEADLIARVCNEQNNDRELAKRELLWYILQKYLPFLIHCARNFEDKHGLKLSYDCVDVSKDFILWIIEKNKLCSWKKVSLKKRLAIMFHNYLVDKIRKDYGRPKKDQNGKKVCKRVIIPFSDLPLSENEEGEIIENLILPEKPSSQEEEILDKLMLDEILQIQKRALLYLQKINPQDAKIVYMVMQGISRPEMAEKLRLEKSSINTTVQRAFQKYAVIFRRFLKEGGIEPKISIKKLKECLIDVTKG